ncbi:hypothetical protein ACFB49_38530 [Sphingomonas sp. DBB INV C78]
MLLSAIAAPADQAPSGVPEMFRWQQCARQGVPVKRGGRNSSTLVAQAVDSR